MDSGEVWDCCEMPINWTFDATIDVHCMSYIYIGARKRNRCNSMRINCQLLVYWSFTLFLEINRCKMSRSTCIWLVRSLIRYNILNVYVYIRHTTYDMARTKIYWSLSIIQYKSICCMLSRREMYVNHSNKIFFILLSIWCISFSLYNALLLACLISIYIKIIDMIIIYKIYWQMDNRLTQWQFIQIKHILSSFNFNCE